MTESIDRRGWRLEYFEAGYVRPYLIETFSSLEDLRPAAELFTRLWVETTL